MTLKTRRYLFYSLTIIFVFVASTIVLYSQGYKINLSTQSIEETGGIYIKSNPSDVDIFVDGESIKNQSGLIQSGTLVSGLSTRTYEVSLSKDGYSSWSKNTKVISGIVSIFDQVILIPDKQRTKIAETAEKFVIRDSEILIKEKGKILFEENIIVGNEILSFSDDGKVLSFSRNTNAYYLSDISKLDSTLNLSIIFNNLKETRLDLAGVVPIRKIKPYPYNSEKFIVMTGRALYTIDTNRLEIEQISPEVNDFILSGSNILWNNDDGLFSYQLVFRTNSEVILPEDFDFKRIKQVSIDPSDTLVGALSSNGNLILFDTKLSTTTEIFSNISSFRFSPDGSAIIMVKNNTDLGVYYITDQEVRDEVFVQLTTIPNHVESLEWYKDSSHIFVRDTAGILFFIEIDDEFPINVVEVSTNVKSFQYDEEDNALYYDNGIGIFSLILKD